MESRLPQSDAASIHGSFIIADVKLITSAKHAAFTPAPAAYRAVHQQRANVSASSNKLFSITTKLQVASHSGRFHISDAPPRCISQWPFTPAANAARAQERTGHVAIGRYLKHCIPNIYIHQLGNRRIIEDISRIPVAKRTRSASTPTADASRHEPYTGVVVRSRHFNTLVN
jgi:hypothetical protein